MSSIISVQGLTKTQASGSHALDNINFDIRRGAFFALRGPNGAGKTTLISSICGIVTASAGTVIANGHDTTKDFRAARQKIGLVRQELSTCALESVWAAIKFSHGRFGKALGPALMEKILRDLSLWKKRMLKSYSSAAA